MRESLLNLARAVSWSLAVAAAEDFPAGIGRELLHLKQAADAAVPRYPFAATPAHEYGALLDACLHQAPGGDLPIVAALRAAQAWLPWTYSYARRPTDPHDIAERIAFAELIGPDGPMRASAARVGFTLMAANTVYPLHAHPAVELYWVISGQAHWTNAKSQAWVPPGEFVLHGRDEPHAMRTADEPLLALWGWSGDIDAPAAYI